MVKDSRFPQKGPETPNIRSEKTGLLPQLKRGLASRPCPLPFIKTLKNVNPSKNPKARRPRWNQAVFNMKTFRSAGTNIEDDVVCILRTTDKQLRKSRVKAAEHAFEFLGFSFESVNRRPKESKL